MRSASGMLLAAAALFGAVPPAAGAVELIEARTPWRVWLVSGAETTRDQDGRYMAVSARGRPEPLDMAGARLSALPPEGWPGADFDDAAWGRYGDELADWAGLFGRDFRGKEQPTLLCLRTRFGVSDPSRAADLKLSVEYVGGVVAYVNGTEVGRGHLPAGKIEPCAPAADYPVEAYTVADNQTPLPRVLMGGEPDAQLLPRYRLRVRTLTAAVPPRVLVKGANVLALELHRSAPAGPASIGKPMMWWHLGVGRVRLTSASGAGSVGYADALRGVRVWNAQAVEQVTDRPGSRSTLDRGLESISLRGAMQVGLTHGNPFDPLRPVRLLVPRGGVGNGQVVLTDLSGLRDVRVSISDLRGPGGRALPAGGVRLRFGVQGEDLHWCDNLADRPPEGAKTVPVWLEATAPKDQPAGWYAGTLSLQANGKRFQVPAQVFVSGFASPDPRDFRSTIVAMHSPEAAARTYNVGPYGQEHFALMGQSLAFAAQLGGDVMFVPVIAGTHMHHETGLIRWVKSGGGMKPDFRLFEKYLDLYVKHCGAPKAISLYVWSQDVAQEAANAYEGRQIPTRQYEPKRPLQVTLWDPQTGETQLVAAPNWLEPDAGAFWKPLLDGVRDRVTRRGWPERVILLGIGSDTRPSVKTGEVFRQWAPYARWDLYSHFSGDPGAGGIGHTFYKGPPLPGWAPGKFIAIGDLEVGLKEVHGYYLLNSAQLEASLASKDEYLTATVQRVGPGTKAGPMIYRAQALIDGRWARLGVDFWPRVSRYNSLIWGATPLWLTWPGPDGPRPTVRLQLIREGLQDFEARVAIAQRLGGLPAEEQRPYRELLDDLGRRTSPWSGPIAMLPQTELSYDWFAYVARLHAAAAELAGVKVEAAWDRPPPQPERARP